MVERDVATGPHERAFLGWDQPILHSVADRLVEAAGPVEAVGMDGRMDLSGIVVALPGGRAGRRLGELILDRAEEADRPLRPPRIITVGRLPEEFYVPELPIPDSVLERLAWREAFARIAPGDRSALLPEEYWPVDPRRGSTGIPLSLEAGIRLLHREVGSVGKDFTRVAELCRRAGSYNDEERWAVLAGVQRRFREILEGLGFRDREAGRRIAIREAELTSDHEVWIAGAPDLPVIAKSFLAAAAPAVRMRVLVGAPVKLADRFDAWGCVRPEAWEDVEIGVRDEAIRVVSGPVQQAEAAVAHLASLDGEVSAEEITIGVPDTEVVPFLVERLEERDVRVRDARGTPLERTPPYRLLAALREYLRGRGLREFAALVRHPAVELALSRRMDIGASGLTEALDRYHTEHLQARFGREPLPGVDTSRSGDAWMVDRARRELDDLLGGAEISGARAESRPLSRWAGWIARVVETVFEEADREPGSESERRLTEAFQVLGGVLDRLARIPRDLDTPVPAHDAIRLVLDELTGTAVAPEAAPDAIELLGWLELALDDAPVMTITGFNEPHVPESTTADAFLPHRLRTDLGLIDNQMRWARDLLSLKTILETRRDLRVIAGRRDASGNPLRLSRLLLAEAPPVLARRLVSFLEEDGQEAAATPAVEGPVPSESFPLPPEPMISDPEPPDEIRVTAFRGLLRDPYEYALQRILGLERVDDEAREMDPLRFGSLAHRILESFGRTHISGEEALLTDTRAIREWLDRRLDSEARFRFGRESLPAVTLQIEQLRARLSAFAERQAEWAGEGWRIRAVEASPDRAVPFEVDGSPIGLTGTIDRVDENVRTGEWCVLDYKTSSKAKFPDETHRAGRSSNRRWIDLQLPLYRRLVGSIRHPDSGEPLVPEEALDSLHLGYVVLPRDPEAVGMRLTGWSADELAQADEEARECIRLLRENRFVFDRARSVIDSRHDLGRVVGAGVLMPPRDLAEEPDDD